MQIKHYKDCSIYKTGVFTYRILNEDLQDTHQLFINSLVFIQIELFSVIRWSLIFGIAKSDKTISLITPTFNVSVYS